MKYVHDSILQEALSLKQCIDLPLQFPKFRLVRCFTLSFYDTGLQTGHQIKEVTDWNVYQENNTSIGSQEGGGGGGEGLALPCSFSRKYPGCGHLWVKFLI